MTWDQLIANVAPLWNTSPLWAKGIVLMIGLGILVKIFDWLFD